MTHAFTAPADLATARLARVLPLALRDGQPGSRLRRVLALLGLATLASGCSAGMGLVSVPLVGSVPVGDVAPLTQSSMMAGMSVAELEEQCLLMAQMAADPGQPQAMRQNLSQGMVMMGCRG